MCVIDDDILILLSLSLSLLLYYQPSKSIKSGAVVIVGLLVSPLLLRLSQDQ